MLRDLGISLYSALLAQDIRREKGDLQTLVGVLPPVWKAQSIPVRLPLFHVRLEFEAEREFSDNLTVEITGPAGTSVIKHVFLLKVTRGHNVLVVGWSPAVFTEQGKYRVLFGKGDDLEAVREFELRKAAEEATPKGAKRTKH